MEPPSSSSSPDLQTLPSPSNWEHDVFLSFRGEDTRYNFTDHLSYAMTQKRIKTFRDAENLRRGKSNSPELLRAIEESKFAVIVLSTNYAASTLCLDELAHIVECKRLRGMEVLPVFYHVEPSDIRRQIGNYGEAFAKHDSNFKNTKVKNWGEALEDIASLSGWHVTHDRRESEVIQEIVNKILNVLNTILYVPNGELVGIDGRIKEIESLLDLKSNDVLTIGIWGMGGIGKTTLAKEVFKKIRNQFNLSGFVSHVRLQSAVELQQRLCDSFLEIGNISIDTVENGIKLLKKAFFKKKVLIVLDDVDSVKQIECLAPGGLLGEDIWGGGSRVIVTTRDRSWLRDFYVQENDIYEVEKLSDEEAFQLLCKEAFEKENPPEEFVVLSKSFLKYAGGLPLAHKVLGSHLSKLKVDEWSHILHRLDNDRDEEIFSVLQVSFDGLQDTDKRIFLDIACFFNGEDFVRVNNILKGCGFSSGIGINNLIDKSLIKVEKSKLWMHDLLQCLGWHIVRGESSVPGKRSRLWVDNNAHKYKDSWRFRDALKVLMDNTGTAAVEGLFLSLPEREEMPLKVDQFLNMRNLRLLKIYNVNFIGVHFKHIFRNLRLLEWHECPLQSLPSNFKLVKLVELKMPNSRIKQLWNESRSLGMLTIMDLSHCQSLAMTPDFSQVPNLERLILQGCKGLTDIHHTIGNLQKLNFLNLRGCRNLESLPQSISLSSLKIFILSGCSKLEQFPQSVENMGKLSELYLDGTAIQELPVSIQHLEGLVTLNLNGCKNLVDLPSIICSCLSSLKFMYLSFCSSLDKLPDNIGFLEHLEELNACNTAIRKVPPSISLLKNLKLLCFHGCSGLTGLELPNKFSGLSSLTTLNLGKCNLAEGAIPDDIGGLLSLQSLDLSENNFFTIPESISQLPVLTEVSLFKCSKLRSLPKHVPSSLRNVNVRGCPMLTNSSSSWRRYPPQKGSSVINCHKPEDNEIFPEPHKMEVAVQSSLSSSSSSPPHNWEHDVFLSFQGEDTRHDFVDHLYSAMNQRGVNAFIDTEKLQRGRFISPELLKAIEESKFVVTVLSTNYATSTWCLDELAHIVGCKKLRGLEVLPVFYHVEPSEIRKQTGNYSKAFAKYETDFKDNMGKVKNWREALKEVASLSGWHVTDDRRVAEVIQEIVDEILNISDNMLHVPGMDTCIKEVESCLSNDVLIVGIWGIALFQQLFDGVIKAHREAKELKPMLENLKVTLESCRELVQSIEQVDSNGLPFREPVSEAFKVKMKEGIELIEKCHNIQPLKEQKHVGKLRALNISIQTLFAVVDMHVQTNLRARLSRLQSSVNHDQNIQAQNRTEKQIRGWCAVPNPPAFTVGLEEPLTDLKMNFLYNDQVSMLVVNAPGGCGKTTLAQKFCQDKQVQDTFKQNIFFVTVTQMPNLEVIVGELCQRTGSQVPAFQSEANALTWLQEFLTETGKNRLLLVLDDVWLGSSKSLLGKCHEFKGPNYKILVTSRDHFPEFGSRYKLRPLNDEDAMSLFLDTTSLKDNELDIPRNLVEKTVELCKGSPLVISVIGKDLCKKPAEIWKRRVMELSKGSSILECDKELLGTLQSSLDALGNEKALVKECFIDLGSFPEDRRIPAATIIDMWSELYGQYGLYLDFLCIALLHDLSNHSLANLVVIRNAKENADGYYNEHFVTQHDILRTLAIHQTAHDPTGHDKRLNIDICKDEFPNWWTEQKPKPKKTCLLSISTDGEFSSKWHNVHLPKAKVLVLNFQTKNYAFPKFKHMSKSLKVLIVTNYGVLPAEVSNFTSLGSLSELKRLRLEHISVPPITKNSIELKRLQKISLFMCNIRQAFSSGSFRFSKAFPRLEEINIDYCSDLEKLPADIQHLIHLKKFSVTNCHKLSELPEMIGELVNLETLRLRSCTDLSKLPASVRRLGKLKDLDISNCYSIKELPEHIGEMCCLEKLDMRQCSRLNELPGSILDLKMLTDVICDEDTKGLWEPYLPDLSDNIKFRVVKEEISLDWLH